MVSWNTSIIFAGRKHRQVLPSAFLPQTKPLFLEGDVQKTKNITLNGDHRNYITLSLPEGVTYHDTAGKEQKGGSIKIYGGTTFLLYCRKKPYMVPGIAEI